MYDSTTQRPGGITRPTGKQKLVDASKPQSMEDPNKPIMMQNRGVGKQQPIAKPNIGKPAVALGVNKKKPLLAPGSVRANAARQSQMMRDKDLQMQQQPALDLAPTQLPFDTGVQPGPMPPEMMPPPEMPPGAGLNVGPSQLPFNPNSGIAGNQDQIMQALAQIRGGQPPAPQPMNPGIGADPRIMAMQQQRMLQQRQGMQQGLQVPQNQGRFGNRMNRGY